jgi:hypothetical protein
LAGDRISELKIVADPDRLRTLSLLELDGPDGR